MTRDDMELLVEKLAILAEESGCKLTKSPAQTRHWLESNSRLPHDIVEFLATSWPDNTVYFGPYRLDELSHISESERAKIAFAGGFFYIGAAGNGDLLVIRPQSGGLEDCEIGLISHEELWEKESNLKSIYEPICRGFKALLAKAEIEDVLPLDYYDAKERREKSSQQTSAGDVQKAAPEK